MSNREHLDEGTKRAVRQRCAFGCVKCGLPLYEYHHIDEYAAVRAHEPENITLLCDLHHKMATNGLLTPEQVKQANANPINVRRRVSAPFNLELEGDRLRYLIGSNRFTATGAATFLAIDNNEIVGATIDGGQLFLNLAIFDATNRGILAVVRNEIWVTTEPWDIKFVRNRLTLRESAGQIALEIRIVPPDTLHIARGHLYLNGVHVIIFPDAMVVNGEACMFSENEFTTNVGIVVGQSTLYPSCVCSKRGAYQNANEGKTFDWLISF